MKNTAETFWQRVNRSDSDGCWPFTGRITMYGYGEMKWEGRETKAHRIAFALSGGVVPEGMQLDHLCRNRACCNPSHLEVVTGAENTRRGLKGVLGTHCKNNHKFTPENTKLDKRGQRVCIECARTSSREWWRRNGNARRALAALTETGENRG